MARRGSDERGPVRLEYPGKHSERQILRDTPAASLQCSAEHGVVDPGAWSNMLIHGDNMQVLRRLWADKQAGTLANADGTPGVRLIYIDPPFGTEQDFAGHRDAPAYSDRRAGAEFIEHLRRRLILLANLLSDDGSIYVHLDEKRSHYIKIVLDEIFGEQGFQREIIWRIGWVSGFKSKANNWIRNHDTILYYSKDPQRFVFNKSYIPYPEGYRRRDGKQPTGAGVPLEDTWNCSEADSLNSIQIVSFSREKTGYPTQKSEALLDRIIRASSNPGDLVLDAFCGSGTTCAVAEKTGRRWIGIDAGKLAIATTQSRLLRLGRHGPGLPRAFRRYHAVGPDPVGLDVDCAPEAIWTVETVSGETEFALQKFQTNAAPERGTTPRSFDGLSAVQIDFDYREVFRPGFFALRDDLERTGYRCRVDPATVGRAVMLAAIDVYGNESRSVVKPARGRSRRSTVKKPG